MLTILFFICKFHYKLFLLKSLNNTVTFNKRLFQEKIYIMAIYMYTACFILYWA